ncbi:hypothetical protein PTKIN_Ptkin07bG0303400 [Pterospermum kingtungense]
MVPKHSAIGWMAILNRLPTKDRLLKFSRIVWKSVLLLCNLRRDVLSWNEELHWASRKLRGKSLPSTVLRWAWVAFIYFIWKERNFRLHRQVEHSERQIVDEIKQVIRVKVSDFNKVKKDLINCSLVHA